MEMKILWAPWRMRYIRSCSKDSGCFLCRALSEDRDEENLILLRGEKSFIIMNRYPYNNGHLMIAPKRHVGDLLQLSDGELVEMAEMVKLAIKALKSEYNPDGFNIGLNLGRAAGAGLEDHLHIHVIPRWVGDTNFMPIISETKTIPELLTDSYSRLKKYFE